MEPYSRFPPLPSFLSYRGVNIDKPFVEIHLLEGGSHTGRFLGLNASERVVVMEGNDEVVTRIPLSHLRFLEFADQLEFSRRSSDGAPPSLENYQIQFRDGRVLQGKSYSHNIDANGVHLYNALGHGKVERLFVPIESVNDYSFGEATIVSGNGNSGNSNKPMAKSRQGAWLCHNKAELQVALDQLGGYLGSELGKFSNKRIGEILVLEKIITQETLDEALDQQRVRPGRKLGAILESMGRISTDQINQKLAEKLGIPLVSLKKFEIDVKLLNKVPAEFCKRYHLLPLFEYKDHLVVALDDPLNFEALDVVRFITGKSIESVLALTDELEKSVDKFYGSERNIDDGLSMAEADAELGEFDYGDMKEVERLAKEKPIVRLVSGVISDAIHKNASDIHIRPLDKDVQLLYRIDGSLVEIRTFSHSLLPAIISRIKIIGRMDVAERRLPQDGRARVSEQGALVDLRISVMPTIKGESAVIRLLNTKIGLRSVDEIGLDDGDQEQLVDLLNKNYGMFLVTGPTGSGKSTTLYAALQNIKQQNVNIITVEDPVEYQISGIEQIQIQSGLGYTFAESLRHILRHDPDVIMVGEIRDVETAKIAVESALTGHLVLSTLHTNSAAGTVTRLIEMGVEPYLVSSTLLGVLAQRLVKKNCPNCIDVEQIGSAMRRSLGIEEDEVFYKGKGCDSCHQTGYSGRMAVYELLLISSSLRELIEKAKSTDSILQQAISEGMETLTKNALKLARKKVTSLSEVYRVRLD